MDAQTGAARDDQAGVQPMRTQSNRVAAGMLALLAGLSCVGSGALGQPESAVEPAQTPKGQAALPEKTYQTTVERTEIRERALTLLVMAAAESPAPQVRANALEALTQAPTRAERAVRAGLEDKNLGVRFAAAFAAGKARVAGVKPELQRALTDPSPDVRAAAIYALRALGEETDPSALAGMLEHGGARLQSNVAMLMGEMGNASAAPILRSVARRSDLKGNPSEQRLLRLQIAEALYRLGDTEAIHAVRAALFPVGPEDVEAATLAAQVIGNVGDVASAATLKNRILDRVGDEKSGRQAYLMPPELRLAAATSLGKLGIREGEYLADEFAGNANPLLRAQAAFLFGETAGPERLWALERMLEDASELARVAAARSVVRVVDRATAEGR